MAWRALAPYSRRSHQSHKTSRKHRSFAIGPFLASVSESHRCQQSLDQQSLEQTFAPAAASVNLGSLPPSAHPLPTAPRNASHCPTIWPLPLRHHPPISAPCSPGAAATAPAACGRVALNRIGPPSLSLTAAPDGGSCDKAGGTLEFSKAAGRESHAKSAFSKKPAPRPTVPSDTGKRFVQPMKPRG
jgi:hypothetical protein